MKIFISGGGTGGHIYPALAIAQYIEDNNIVKKNDIIFIGNKNKMEADIIPKYGYKMAFIDIIGFPRKISLKLLKFIFKFFLSIFQTIKIIKKYNPKLIIGTGGYVSFLPIILGKLMGKSTIILEQNYIPGLSNKILARFSDIVFISFEETKKFFKINEKKLILTGTPIIKKPLTENGNITNIDKKLYNMRIGVVGGSSGARKINEFIKNFIITNKEYIINKNLLIIWITGKRDFNNYQEYKVDNNVIVIPYCDNMKTFYQNIDFIISRSGAMSVYEISLNKIPAFYIPYPYATDNHQYYNAKYFRDKGVAIVYEEKNLSQEKFNNILKEFIENKTIIETMKNYYNKLKLPNTQEIIINVIKKYYKTEGKNER